MATSKELHALMAKTGHCVHVATISEALHKSGLYGRVPRRKPWLKKAHLEPNLRYAKNHSGDSEAMWQKVLWLTKPRWNFLAEMQNVTFGTNPTQHITQRTPFPMWSMVVAASYYGDVSYQQGLGHLSGLEGKINWAKYRKILEENLLPSARKLKLGWKFTF